jgi:hypothetical protein
MDDDIDQIMLVADGEPNHSGLSSMTYRSNEVRDPLKGFYSHQRQAVILQAIARSRSCRPTIRTYIMTTGHGAISTATSIAMYNVPGELSITQSTYLDLYQKSLMQMLSLNSASIKQVSFIYYAAVSKASFRERIFRLLHEMSVGQKKPVMHACMYGTKFHASDKWDHLCSTFDAL